MSTFMERRDGINRSPTVEAFRLVAVETGVLPTRGDGDIRGTNVFFLEVDLVGVR